MTNATDFSPPFPVEKCVVSRLFTSAASHHLWSRWSVPCGATRWHGICAAAAASAKVRRGLTWNAEERCDSRADSRRSLRLPAGL